MDCRCASLDAVVWDLLRGWLDSCLDDDPSCHETMGTASEATTLRVIDCNSRKLVTIELPAQQWATLSYVLGESQATSHNNAKKDNILHTVPPLINDALHATKALSIR